MWLPLAAQAPSEGTSEQAATASVSGVVLKADSGEPLKKARVALWSNERETSYEAVTDAEGRFQILGVKPGRYRVWASREGYVTSSFGNKSSRRRTPTTILEPGQHLRDVNFRLQRTVVITGRVVNEDGEPMPDVEISLSVRERSVRRRMMQQQSVKTNDLGEYRIFRIDPGKYYLSATPPNRYSDVWATMSTSQEAEDHKSDTKNQPPTYAPVFYPGTTDFDQAARLVVKAADELRVDFTFAPVEAYRIRGRVLGALLKTKEPMVVVLASHNGRGMDQQAARVRNDGTYEIYPVVPGSYRLAVSTGSAFYDPMMQNTIKSTVEVTNSDLDNVDLSLPVTRRTEIKGRVTVEGDTAAKLNTFVVILASEGEDDEFSPGSSAQVNADGTFLLQQVSPGTYSIEVNSIYGRNREYYVKSGRYGNRDLVQSSFTVTEASSPRLELVFSSATARVEGLVLDDTDLPVPGATVVAVPASKFRNLNYWYPDGVTDQNGRFVLPKLRPGDYQVLAFEDSDYLDSLDPSALEKTENARVSAQAGGTGTVKLKLIPFKEDQQQARE